MPRTITVKGMSRVTTAPDYVVISMSLEAHEQDYEATMELGLAFQPFNKIIFHHQFALADPQSWKIGTVQRLYAPALEICNASAICFAPITPGMVSKGCFIISFLLSDNRIGGRLVPLPHHPAYRSVPRRFNSLHVLSDSGLTWMDIQVCPLLLFWSVPSLTFSPLATFPFDSSPFHVLFALAGEVLSAPVHCTDSVA